MFLYYKCKVALVVVVAVISLVVAKRLLTVGTFASTCAYVQKALPPYLSLMRGCPRAVVAVDL